MITQESIQKINDIPLVDIAEKYLTTPIKKAGVNFQTNCIWHKDSSPSFVISPVKGIATCFVCSKSIGGIGLVMEVENLNYPEAIKHLAKSFNIEIKENFDKKLNDKDRELAKQKESLYIANNWAAEYYHNNLLNLLTANFSEIETKPEHKDEVLCNFPALEPADSVLREVSYIFKRFKYSYKLIKHFKIGYAYAGSQNLKNAAQKAGFKEEILIEAGLLKEMNQNSYVGDYFVHRPMIIPIVQSGKIVGFGARQMPWNKQEKEFPKFINTADTLIYKKSEVMFGADNVSQKAVQKADKVYLVEGYTDKTSLFHLGIKNVFAKSGTALTDIHCEKIKKLTVNVCLLDDGDKAGQDAMRRNAEKLTMAGYNVTVLTLAKEHDPDTFFTSAEHFAEFEQDAELDYIIDIVANEQYAEANTVQKKQAIQTKLADLLLAKTKENRTFYINEIAKNKLINKFDLLALVKNAALKARNKGLNIAEESGEQAAELKADNSEENKFRHDWYYHKTNAKGEPTGLKIDSRKFLLKLKSTREYVFETKNGVETIYFGYYIYTMDADMSNVIFVQLRNGRIRKVSVNLMKDNFLKFVKLLQPVEKEIESKEGNLFTEFVTAKDLETLVIDNITSLFNPEKLLLFPDKKIDIIRDTMFNHYTFFRNCYVISDKHGYRVHDYEELKDGYVWEDAVLEHDFTKPKTRVPGMYEKFIHDITGNEWNLETNKPNLAEPERLKGMQIALGYFLHNYTEMQRKIVIIQQGRLSESDNSEGREGKTLAIMFLGENMLNREKNSKTFVYIDGKETQGNDKHKYQDIENNTTAVLYDDPPGYINFEGFYIVAERAFKVEKKNQAPLYVQARMFITTNRPIERDSGSSRARSTIIELDSPYSADYEPADKYKCWFGRDWDTEEWTAFFDYALGTLLPAYFLNNMKLYEPPTKNLHRNELVQKCKKLTGSTEIIFWLDFLTRGNKVTPPYFERNCSYSSKDLSEKLLKEQNVPDEKKLKRNFAPLLQAYLEKEGIAFEKDRDATGTVFKIMEELKSATIPQEQIEKWFNDGFCSMEDLNDDAKKDETTKGFNSFFNLNISAEQLKKLCEPIMLRNAI